jgi:copper(I)-binding protein
MNACCCGKPHFFGVRLFSPSLLRSLFLFPSHPSRGLAMRTFQLPSFTTPATLRRSAAIAFTAALVCQTAIAQTVVIKDAWARATVQGQMASGAFMSLSSATGARLKSVSSPVAGVAQVHEMRMEGDIMKMQALENGLELPAGKTVELKPGGYHVMLMDLKLPLKKDSSIPMTLVFVDAKGVESKTEIKVPIHTTAPTAPMAPMHSGK